ncbi:hypothetical protein TvY486_0025530 [Trypanosoma vivax Y486]|uniref:Uncharacterized protein n=1 Tax=Trypanosoma vivax (strain Y486) TaxID=1055687 RepID=F9WQK7_TRYVY|nr:hypothetical protein TvY486_0025530 [Trypanosoma vivax Y486]|eukprot:CCD19835.1 hypothetical protein TvY486_0025530 [Trypanosoma vivax Y486]
MATHKSGKKIVPDSEAPHAKQASARAAKTVVRPYVTRKFAGQKVHRVKRCNVSSNKKRNRNTQVISLPPLSAAIRVAEVTRQCAGMTAGAFPSQQLPLCGANGQQRRVIQNGVTESAHVTRNAPRRSELHCHAAFERSQVNKGKTTPNTPNGNSQRKCIRVTNGLQFSFHARFKRLISFAHNFHACRYPPRSCQLTRKWATYR